MATDLDFSMLDESLGGESSDTGSNLIPVVELSEDAIDPSYTRLSYSGLQDLHACPRYFQLKKLKAEQQEDKMASLTFAFGHAVGTAIADLVSGKSLEQTLFELFATWEVDFFEENPKQKKSIAHAVAAVQMLHAKMQDGFLSEYVVAKFKGEPAAELSFRVTMPSTFASAKFTYRGYLDLVLQNIMTGEFTVLENKTSSGTWVNHYMYKNSAQALGYSVILDAIVEAMSGDVIAAYDVLYLVFMTKLDRYEDFNFPKSYQQRALWLCDIMWDASLIEKLVREEGNYGIWPMHGESCYRFGRTCEYMDMCHMDTEYLMEPLRENQLEELDKEGNPTEYHIEYRIEELL